MKNLDARKLLTDYEKDGVVLIREFFSPQKAVEIRSEIGRYIREDLDSKPDDARTYEADGVTVRNLWRLEKHNQNLCDMVESEALMELIGPFVNGAPLLVGIETFNKPARIGSGIPYHQDNSYFCQSPPDMLTVWVAMDAVTNENGPIFFVKGSHKLGSLPTKPSGVKGNSIGMAEPSTVPLDEQFCGLLNPGDATIHHCNTIHHSAPNTTECSRLGLLLVFRGSHTETDAAMKAIYSAAVEETPPG